MAEEICRMSDDIDGDEIIIRKKKAPEQRAGVTAASVLKTAAEALEALRAKRPLVQCMTNTVSSNFTANALLALGATSVVVEDLGEASQFTSSADSILVNVGTVTKPQADTMRAAVSRANSLGRPWALDPAGVGALPLRTFTVKELMRRFPSIIRGNASEIAFLAGVETAGRGVESTISSDEVMQAAPRLAGVTRAAVLVSGAVDYVAAEGAPLVAVANGSPLMARVNGVGSVQGAVAAAFLGTLGGRARWESALAASLVVSVAGELAVAKGKTLGAFPAAFIDALDAITSDDLVKHGKVKVG